MNLPYSENSPYFISFPAYAADHLLFPAPDRADQSAQMFIAKTSYEDTNQMNAPDSAYTHNMRLKYCPVKFRHDLKPAGPRRKQHINDAGKLSGKSSFPLLRIFEPTVQALPVYEAALQVFCLYMQAFSGAF